MKLDKFLKTYTNQSIQASRKDILAGIVSVNGIEVKDRAFDVNKFMRVCIRNRVIQNTTARYIMLNKPQAVVSATEHEQHLTVLDSIDYPYKHELHLAGRLDFNTTGLMLLTNDGLWSRRLTIPDKKIPKVYLVETENPITPCYVEKFLSGMHLAYEDITLQPAILEILTTHTARLTIFEGRYHQIKRMFGFYDNKVTALHRVSMGEIVLDAALALGECRELTQKEIASVR